MQQLINVNVGEQFLFAHQSELLSTRIHAVPLILLIVAGCINSPIRALAALSSSSQIPGETFLEASSCQQHTCCLLAFPGVTNAYSVTAGDIPNLCHNQSL